MARNPLQIDLHLVILLPQFFYSRSCLIGIVLASSDFSTFQSFQSSLTVRKNPDFSCPYIHFFIGKIYCFFDSKQFCIKDFALVERLLPEMGCSIQPKTYSPTSYPSGRKAPHQLYTLSH